MAIILTQHVVSIGPGDKHSRDGSFEVVSKVLWKKRERHETTEDTDKTKDTLCSRKVNAFMT